MRPAGFLIVVLLGLTLIGGATEWLVHRSDPATGRTGWMVFLLGAPLLLSGLVWKGWSWAAMACVMYGTVGLALDVATLTSLAASHERVDSLFPLSGISGFLNLSLIVAGGYAFVQSWQRPWPPESRLPNPPSPSSSSEREQM